NWLDSIEKETHACFFYTTEEEFFAIAGPYLQTGLEKGGQERLLWILPPNYSFARGKEALETEWGSSVEAHLRRRRLILMPWDRWYGLEVSIQELLKRARQLLDETLAAGFQSLKILTHSPHRSSSYWKDFFIYEEAFPKRFGRRPVVSLCAYSLIDCPAQAVSSVALNHSFCLIHRGSEWEWLENKHPKASPLTL
ncbi:MAG: MEDS domain-containing protein, partial [Deltaproteobacteria bacterium]|nr:MEDS domain-containing protein [Deltaproteobacteria bacterium]